jgi:hypothetical protein
MRWESLKRGRRKGASPIQFQGTALIVPGGFPLMTAAVLQQGLVDTVVSVWQFWGDTVDPLAVTKIYEGFLDGADSLTDPLRVNLYEDSSKALFLPRDRVRAGPDFPVLPAPGYKFTWAGVVFQLV